MDLGYLVDTMNLEKETLSEGEIKCFMLQILNGINYLHQNYIIHRDLKLSNIMIDSKGVLKLGDFGLSKQFGKNYFMKSMMTLNIQVEWLRFIIALQKFC